MLFLIIFLQHNMIDQNIDKLDIFRIRQLIEANLMKKINFIQLINN